MLLVVIAMQATNYAIAACLHFRREFLGHARANQGALALVVANTVLRMAAFYQVRSDACPSHIYICRLTYASRV